MTTLQMTHPGLTTIKLYGRLGKLFGKIHHFAIDSPREAVAALCANYKGFREHLLKYSEPGYHILVSGKSIGEDELEIQGAAGKIIKIIPEVEGAGGNSWGMIILGIAIIAMSGGFGAGWWVVGGGGWLAGVGLSIGTAMVLGGVAQLLAGAPKAPGFQETNPNNQPSYAFNGPVNTQAQGHPVPICYGMLRVGSAVIGNTILVEDYFPNADNDPKFHVSNMASYDIPVDTLTSSTGSVNQQLYVINGTGPYTWVIVDAPGPFTIVLNGSDYFLRASALTLEEKYKVTVQAAGIGGDLTPVKMITFNVFSDNTGGGGDDPNAVGA